MHGFFNCQLETCGSRDEDFQRQRQFSEPLKVLKDVGMIVGSEMFTVTSGKVSIGFITFCSDLEVSWCSPRFKSRVGLGPRILSLRV